MKKINRLLKKYDIKPHRYQKRGNIYLVDAENVTYVLKEKKDSKRKEIFKYLNSRSFNYYPEVYSSEDDDYEISEYIEEIQMPKEQKILDLINLVALLHNKTTYYKEVDYDDFKKTYEDIQNNIEYLFSYYNDITTIIESRVYMSPSEYLFIRNISKIYSALNYSKGELEKWYKMVEQKKKRRFVVLHNNLELNHFIENNSAYLISWDKAKVDIPIFDIYKLYKKHALDFDFEVILYNYEKSYPLLEEERLLLFILISLPNKIEFNDSEYNMCKVISKQIDYLYKTEKLLSSYCKNVKN